MSGGRPDHRDYPFPSGRCMSSVADDLREQHGRPSPLMGGLRSLRQLHADHSILCCSNSGVTIAALAAHESRPSLLPSAVS
ncbi:hypothetical protein K466DRAFT_299299 [Polyporus arcularius HHB13444]|uniref:Uncharacterized protein n=1 Tax=Polyporus arcularius HHB13444 TaxID=1314778 RepID=A0A5C3P0E7_9APHY|nr:hypothetical protein K466DRAFT_299299 [Polyporus arcularius HHB13444]